MDTYKDGAIENEIVKEITSNINLIHNQGRYGLVDKETGKSLIKPVCTEAKIFSDTDIITRLINIKTLRYIDIDIMYSFRENINGVLVFYLIRTRNGINRYLLLREDTLEIIVKDEAIKDCKIHKVDVLGYKLWYIPIFSLLGTPDIRNYITDDYTLVPISERFYPN
jgi:hypothetical protein